MNTEQPAPTPNDSPAIWQLVIADMHARDQLGRARYGTPLQAHNGRDALRDAYEEALDLVVYLRQEIAERDGQPAEEADIHQASSEDQGYSPTCAEPDHGPRVEVEWPWDELLVKGPHGTVVLHMQEAADD